MEGGILNEPSAAWISLFVGGAPFLGFYVALLLRHFAFHDQTNPTIWQRLAVAIPTSLILVSSFNALLLQIGEPTVASVAFVTGFVMEQALLIDVGLKHILHAHSTAQSSEAIAPTNAGPGDSSGQQ